MRTNEPTFRALVCGALLATFVHASAWADDVQNPPTAATSSSDSNKLICKREKMTGSNIPRKVCRTQEQIDKEREVQREHAQERNDSSWNAPQAGGGQ